MRRFFRRGLVLTVSSILVLSMLGGCTGNSGGTGAAEDSTEAAEKTETEDKDAGSTEESVGSKATSENEAVTLTWLCPDFVNAELKPDCLALTKIKEATGVTLDITTVPGEDLQTKIETSIAAGQLPDVVCFGNITTLSKYFDAGVFLALNDFMSSSESFKRLFGEIESLEKNMKNDAGNFYYFPQLTQRVYYLNNFISQEFLKKAGKEVPTNLDELEEVLSAFKDLGLTPWSSGPWTGNQWYEPVLDAYGLTLGFYNYSGDKIEYGPYDRKEEFYDALTYLHRIWEKGLVDENAFSISDDDANAKLATNSVGFTYTWGDSDSLIKGGSKGTDFLPAAPIAGPDGKAHMLITQVFSGANFFLNADMSEEKKEAAYRFMEYCYSEEGTELLNWGVEGDTFEVDADGHKRFTDKIMSSDDPLNERRKNGISHTSLPFYSLNEAELQTLGDWASVYDDYADKYAYPAQPVTSMTSEEASDYSAIMTDIEKLTGETFAGFVTGELELNQENFDAYIAKLEQMGIKDAKAIQDAAFERWQNR